MEFHKEFKPFYANTLLLNYSALQLVQSCFDTSEYKNFGMDGDYDLETNLKIDDHTKKAVVYALGSCIKENEDEPLYLVEDTTMADGMAMLKYIPDNDGDDEVEEPSPTVGEEI